MDEMRREPLLLTPGPLTTTRATKEAMLRDWGSRDTEFVAMNARVRRRLLELVSGESTHVCVPLQGSGTFVVEAMVGTLLPPGGRLLALVNGAYGRRIVRMCEYYRRSVVVQEAADDRPVDPAALDAALARDPAVSHVAVVHCETTSGVLNPVEEVAAVTARRGRRLLVDAMSAFGAIPLDARRTPFDAVVASAGPAGLRDLSGQAHGGRQLPHRLHRRPRRAGDERGAGRHPRGARRARRDLLRARALTGGVAGRGAAEGEPSEYQECARLAA